MSDETLFDARLLVVGFFSSLLAGIAWYDEVASGMGIPGLLMLLLVSAGAGAMIQAVVVAILSPIAWYQILRLKNGYSRKTTVTVLILGLLGAAAVNVILSLILSVPFFFTMWGILNLILLPFAIVAAYTEYKARKELRVVSRSKVTSICRSS